MKKILFSMLAMAAMVSCSNENEQIDGINGKVEIKLNAGVVGVETKAELTAFDNTSVSLIRIDEESANAGSIDWGVSTKETATIAAGGAVTLPLAYKFYDTTGKNAYFIGYYPDATIVSRVVSYTDIDGTKDILCTATVDAGNQTGNGEAAFEFKHMLSQVEIQVKGESVAAANFGKITNITLSSVPSEANLTIGTTPTLAQKGGAASDITIYNDATGTAILGTATPIGNIPMLIPGLGKDDASKLVIKITTENKGVSTVNVTNITNGLASGSKHTITLTFKNEISATATIGGWSDGTDADGDVE